MMLGKEKCKYLREIRKKIALENDIRLVTDECAYKGECKGTCPKCEAEVRYLENELERKRKIGKIVTIAGLSLAGLTSGTLLASCGEEEGDVPAYENNFGEGDNIEEQAKRKTLYYNIIERLNQSDINVSTGNDTIFQQGHRNYFIFTVTDKGEIKDIQFPLDSTSYVEEITHLLTSIPQEDLNTLETDWTYRITFCAEDNKLKFKDAY